MEKQSTYPDLWSRLVALDRAGTPLLIYGMGNGGDKLIDRLATFGITPVGVFASDGFVRGQNYRGYTVKTRRELLSLYPDAVTLVAFGSHLPDVCRTLYSLAEEIPLFVPDLPVAGGEYFDADFYRRHEDEILSARALFADEASKSVYSAVLSYKLSGELSDLRKTGRGEYDPASVLHPDTYRRALDAGAYNGDTARKMISLCKNVTEILCVEPDPKTFRRLEKYAGEEGRTRITPIHAALSDECGKAAFASSGNRNSTLFDGSHEAKLTEVETVTVDSIIGDSTVDFIKYDVEGEEEAALLGSRNTISRCRPELLVSAYHKSRDLFALPHLLADLCEDYRFYLRRNECFPAWELDLLAVPEEKCDSYER